MRKLLANSFFAALTALVGCSSSMDDPAPGGPTADQACTDLAGLYCTKIDGCSPLFAQLTYPNTATCKASFKAQCLLSIAAPSTGTSPQKQADCTAAAAGLACTDLFADIVPAQCRPVAGKLADGAACGDDSQCVSKYCSTSETAACGKCGAAPAAGASCATQHCAPGLKCHEDPTDTTGKTKTCVVYGNVGDTCSNKAPCRQDLSCTDGKCGAPANAEGDTCDFNGAGGPQCNLTLGLICNPATKKCLKVKVGEAGAACGYDATSAGSFTACGNAGACRKAKPADAAGTCLAGAAVGSACNEDEDIGPKCLFPAKCVSGACVSPDPSTCK